MRDPCLAKHCPVLAVNSLLLPHRQRRHHAQSRLLALWRYTRKPCLQARRLGLNTVTQPLTPALQPVLRSHLQQLLLRLLTHIACGLNTLFPRLQLIIKTMGVAGTVRAFDPNRQSPALAGAQRYTLRPRGYQRLTRIQLFPVRAIPGQL